MARIAATTHSATGVSWTPLALQSVMPSGTRPSSQSTPALTVCRTSSLGVAARISSTRRGMTPPNTAMRASAVSADSGPSPTSSSSTQGGSVPRTPSGIDSGTRTRTRRILRAGLYLQSSPAAGAVVAVVPVVVSVAAGCSGAGSTGSAGVSTTSSCA